jgi:hypothetical protein
MHTSFQVEIIGKYVPQFFNQVSNSCYECTVQTYANAIPHFQLIFLAFFNPVISLPFQQSNILFGACFIDGSTLFLHINDGIS